MILSDRLRNDAVIAASDAMFTSARLQAQVDSLSAEVSDLTSRLHAATDLAVAEYTRGYNAGLAQSNDAAFNRGRAVGVGAGRGLERGVFGHIAYHSDW